MEMEMDFLGSRSVPSAAATRQGMPLVARRDDDDETSRLAAPSLPSPVRAPHAVNQGVSAAYHREQHSTAPSSQVYANGTRVSPSPQPQAAAISFGDSFRVVDGVVAPPFVPNLALQSATMPTSYLQGSNVVHNAASTTTDPRCSTAQLTIFYAGSVRVFDNVTREQAEQIMLMAAMATQAGSPPVRLQPESAALPNERLMALASVRLSPDTVPQAVFMPRDVPLARNASLTRFLERRKQRVESAATLYSRRERSPSNMGTLPILSPGSTPPFGNTEQPWVFGDANGMNGSRDEEALDTELKI